MAHIFASDRGFAAAKNKTVQRLAQNRAPENDLAQLQTRADQSVPTARLTDLQAMAHHPVQRMEEEDMLQGKAVQRMEDEEMLQGKAIGAPMLQQQSGGTLAGAIPVALQHSIKQMSGHDLSQVTVRSGSSAPAAVGAHAYAQGNAIHLAPGQEKHLPHEAWHVVQQREGRVRPTGDVAGIPVNDDSALETEADMMGAKASQLASKRDRL